ncbi:trypsin-6-like [Toxorhynchites rutilus septentrionalis]|uniref:trypsin-6-like n=1 Tax=Toxorhynchites rutilus septentrionalis TaxID=329112 RepID=UPI002478EEA4|nr:trypsin-6-like [Toxorhynchites rutilus septentrionalis]
MDIKALITLVVSVGTSIITTEANESSTRVKRIIGGGRLPISRVPYQELDILIRAGSDRRNTGGIVRHMKWSIIHPHYSANRVTNDVALILLNTPLVVSSGISCIKMAHQGHAPIIGQRGLVSGWGVTNPYLDVAVPSSYPITLQYTSLPVIDFEWCNEMYPSYTLLRGAQFCAGYVNGGTDTCTGDSGGPFVVDRILVGIISWGVSCAEPYHPGVFSNVGTYRFWIDEVVRQYSRSGAMMCSHYF